MNSGGNAGGGNRSLTGIVLAGGESSRLGTDKALLTIGNCTLLERACGVLSVFCSEILISSGHTAHARFGYRTVPDLLPGKGPMAGLWSGLMAALNEKCLVLAVDNHLVGADYFAYVLAKRTEGYDAAVPCVGGRYFEPLAGYYHRSVLPEMEKEIRMGHFSLQQLFQKVRVLKLEVESEFQGYFPGYFKSLNTPYDLGGAT